MRRRASRWFLAIALGTGALVGLAPAAQAHQDGVINTNDFVFFYNSYWAGSFSDFAWSAPNLAGYTFLSFGNGQGQAVKNNSASVRNRRGQAARVYYNSGFVGANDFVPGHTSVQLSVTYNQNASFQWV